MCAERRWRRLDTGAAMGVFECGERHREGTIDSRRLLVPMRYPPARKLRIFERFGQRPHTCRRQVQVMPNDIGRAPVRTPDANATPIVSLLFITTNKH